MAKNYSIDTTDGVTTVRFSKDPGVEDIRNAIDGVAENYLSKLRLWDLRSVGIKLNSSQKKQLVEYGKSKFLVPSKVAIVAPEDLAYGLKRMYEIYREEGLTETAIFRTEQAARVWLKSFSNVARDI